MPNWCECELYVKGERKEIQQFLEKAKGENGILDFNSFIPYPEEWRKLDKAYWGNMEKITCLRRKLKETKNAREKQKIQKQIEKISKEMPEKDGFNQGGYEWCITNWGTKWNARHLDDYSPNPEELGDNLILVRFDTAWSPPIPVVGKMSEMFPQLEFTLKYFECGMGFQGIFKASKGEVIADKCVEYFGDRGG